MIDHSGGSPGRKKGIKLMTHVVAGFPDLDASREIIETLTAGGADLIEVQIPFSDPTADGPAVTKANHRALENGVRPEDAFSLIEKSKTALAIPFVVMTYANIPFRMGWQRFADRAAEARAGGVIIPDLPFDTEEGREALAELSRQSLPFIPVLSPGMSDRRLKDIVGHASDFLYLTLRVGTTGTVGRTDPNGLAFIARVRAATSLPLAAGFGISSRAQINELRGAADIAVVGSHLIRVFEAEGLAGIRGFLEGIRRKA